MNYVKNRMVLCEDAIKWLESSNEMFEGSVFCGIPDMYDVYDMLPSHSSSSTQSNESSQSNELTESNESSESTGNTPTNGLEFKAKEYKKWFVRTLQLIFQRVPIGQCVILTQTDAKILSNDGNVVSWMDKSYMCISEAEKFNCTLLWHKIAIDSQAEISSHRPCYTHLLCFGKSFQFHTSQFLTPDVIDRGLMTWEKATGLEACLLCLAFLRYVVNAPCVINPFCGKGTILAVANYFGLRSIGIEVMPKRARKALSKDLRNQINSLPIEKFRVLLGSEITNQLFPHLNLNVGKDLKVVENVENGNEAELKSGAELVRETEPEEKEDGEEEFS